jgi:hypothetical protein
MTLMVGAVNTSETSVSFYETTLLNAAEGYHLHSRLCESPKSHMVNFT